MRASLEACGVEPRRPGRPQPLFAGSARRYMSVNGACAIARPATASASQPAPKGRHTWISRNFQTASRDSSSRRRRLPCAKAIRRSRPSIS